MSAPVAFCVRCRALLDPGQACACGPHAIELRLDADGAEAAIEARLLVTPNVDTGELMGNAIVGSITVLGPIAVAFFGIYVVVHLLAPEVAASWPFFLGAPYALLALGWIAFMTWSSMEERKPYYVAADHFAAKAVGIEGRLEAGRLVVTEIHQRGQRHRVVVRDARIEEPLVLRRPGERITVPVGRVEIYLPEGRFRAGSSPLVAQWRALPRALFDAGVLVSGGLRRGDRVVLHDGELVPEGRDETGFREAAEARLRWVPNGGRTKLLVVHG